MKDLSPLGLDSSVLDKLETYEDYLSFFLSLQETSDSFSWQKADLFKALADRHGEKSLTQLSYDIKIPRSTVTNYIRTSRAYPLETRNPMLSFTAHLNTTYVDIYDTKTGNFKTEKRFEYLEKAAVLGWNSNKIYNEIRQEKKTTENPFIICSYCGNTHIPIVEYVLYKLGGRRDPEKFFFHEDCFQTIKSLIKKFG